VTTSVLVVDDDAGFRGLALRILTAAGFDICGEADTWAGGLEAALDLRPPAILVDARLPDGDGIALARQMMALPWAPRVVLISSDVDVAAEVAEVAETTGDGVTFVPKSDLPDAPLDQLLGASGHAG
jgi:DNA-binding response OmpR family regulator